VVGCEPCPAELEHPASEHETSATKESVSSILRTPQFPTSAGWSSRPAPDGMRRQWRNHRVSSIVASLSAWRGGTEESSILLVVSLLTTPVRIIRGQSFGSSCFCPLGARTLTFN
jgi:hypothetical protein